MQSQGCRHGQDKDVFMSLPCIIGARGVVQISKQPLGEWERESLQATATYFYENSEKIFKDTKQTIESDKPPTTDAKSATENISENQNEGVLMEE